MIRPARPDEGKRLREIAIAGKRAHTLEWEAEPHAVGFYERAGGRHVRDSGPSDGGRILPVMAITLPG